MKKIKKAVVIDEPPHTGGSFDDNGHRVKLSVYNHRIKAKVNPKNPEVRGIQVVLDLIDMAKAMQFCKGKEVPSTPVAGRKVRNPMRPMTIQDLMREYIKALTKNVVLDAETQAWYDKIHKQQLDKRSRDDAMVAAGINRIPKDQQLQPGRHSARFNAAKRPDLVKQIEEEMVQRRAEMKKRS